MVKNQSKKTSIFQKINDLIMRNKRESVVVVIFIITLLVLLGLGFFAQYTTNMDRENVSKMRSSVKELIHRIQKSDDSIIMDNKSYCSVRQARAFNEKTYYACNANYIYIRQVENQNEVDKFINIVTATLKRSGDIVGDVDARPSASFNLLADTDKNSYYSATSFSLKGVDLHNKPCLVRYVALDTKVQIEFHVECSTETRQAYFEPIRHE